MSRKLLLLLLALVVLLACGGADPSSQPDAAAPVAGGDPATPADGDDPAALPGGDEPDSESASCRSTVRVRNDRSEFDESCEADGPAASRQCTLEDGGSAWSCLCTAASGARSTCQAPAASGVITPPPDCCPAG